jgi:polysaccharide export outer membrane protein
MALNQEREIKMLFTNLSRARRRTQHLMVMLVAMGGMSACASGDKKLPNVTYPTADFSAPDQDAAPAVASAQATTIAPFDKLEIKVFQVEALSGEFQVNPAGQVSFPLIGSVAAAGKTPAELAQLITTRLAAKYLKNPSVQVNVMEAEAAAEVVTVDGAVKAPGAFPVKGPITLMRAVALSGGLADGANPKRVIVFRTVQGQRMAAGFDLASIRKAEADDPVVYPRDIVVVDSRDNRIHSIFREVLGTIPILAIFRPF